MRGNRWLLKALPDLNSCSCRCTNAVLVPVSLPFFFSFFLFLRPRSPNKLLMFRCGNLQPPLHSQHAAPVDPAGLPLRGAEEVKMAYMMLTAADGFPKVLNNLCLHSGNRKLVSALYF